MTAGARPPTDPAVTVGGGVGRASAVCLGCDWQREGLGTAQWLALRAAARRHVRSTGHTVVAGVVHNYTYAHVPGGRRGAHL